METEELETVQIDDELKIDEEELENKEKDELIKLAGKLRDKRNELNSKASEKASKRNELNDKTREVVDVAQ
ncbi:MAG: phosphoserine phosphatase, partial [Halobacteria archaeon]|nr:phosphoserine phosphatase [Halobacteria archaeon]